MSGLYGAKCLRCACIDHRGRGVEPIPWLSMRGLACDDCPDCQARRLSELIGEVGLDLFSPDVREVVAAVRDGKPHPALDSLRIECLALGAIVEVAGESWFVADAQFDSSEVGSHLHLTLTRKAQP